MTYFISTHSQSYHILSSQDKGLASVGHGDNLFRTPREWSQIGKFERRKAIHVKTEDNNNVARILGKPQYVSPRMAVPGIVLPSYKPTPEERGFRKRKPPHHITSSLPSLAEAVAENSPHRPLSTDANVVKADGDTDRSDRPDPPIVAFADTNSSQAQGLSSKSSMLSSENASNNQQFSTHDKVPKHQLTPRVGNDLSPRVPPGGKLGPISGSFDTSGLGGAPGLGGASGLGGVLGNHNVAGVNVLGLLKETSFSRGHKAQHFHQSQLDKSKEAEYKHMLGNLNSIMDVLSQQQTKSFRKSVEVKKPETPKEVKKKSKVSSLAIIFGGKNASRKNSSRRRKSPGGSAASKRSGKSGRGSARNTKANESSKGQKTTGKSNKMPVPTIKIN